MTDLSELTSLFGLAWEQYKEAEKRKNELRVQFLEATEQQGDSFSYVNPYDGQVYSKSVSSSVMLDDERLKQEDPELYEAVTYIPAERRLKPLEDLTTEQQAALQSYMYESKSTVKVLAPRKASEEELGEAKVHH